MAGPEQCGIDRCADICALHPCQRADREGAAAVLAWLRANMRHDATDKDALFRRRTAEQVLASGFTTGCTDSALAALPLLRALGIPSVYVDTARRDSLENDGIAGHVFVEALLDGRWTLLDPSRGTFPTRYGDYVPIARGHDAWDVGLASVADIRAAFRVVASRARRER